MKSVLIYALGLLFALTLLAVMPLDGEAAIYEDVIRLHVQAASDDARDQENKLAVRDAILEAYGSRLAGATKEEAAARVSDLLPEIKRLAEETLATHGCSEKVTVSFTDEPYPERVYGDLHFPAGTYRSLRVVIGSGTGENWWCVLFPPLCVGAATADVPILAPDAAPEGMSESEWRLVSRSGEYEIRFRVLELLSDLL